MVGPPASGKTSWSKEFVKGKSTWIRVNRNDLRLMCGDYWIPSREKLINTLEETTITSALEQGHGIRIDQLFGTKHQLRCKLLVLPCDALVEAKVAEQRATEEVTPDAGSQVVVAQIVAATHGAPIRGSPHALLFLRRRTEDDHVRLLEADSVETVFVATAN